MGKLCLRGRNFIQVYNADGMVRECSWTRDGQIGNLIDHTLPELYHGSAAKKLRERLLKQDYSQCFVDGCPYLMTGEISNFQVELGELPEYPEELYLAFENICNYKCKSCTIHCTPNRKSKEELNHNYDIIEERVRQAMPYAKKISANGMGELFVCKRTLKLLAEWKPIAPVDQCEVTLETNGFLFDEEHWKQIENLGQYDLHVAITVMSFEEPVYQRLSGVTYPIEKIENNLRFVKKLREQEVVNHFTIATVVQAENFRMLPVFARRCIEEFGADFVRLRPYDNWGGQNEIEEFFMNIRHPKHPWYSEYQEIMKHPYLQNPRVLNNSGGRDSLGMRAVLYEVSDLKWKILTEIIDNSEKVMDKISEFGEFAIYGKGNITTVLVNKMKHKHMSPKYIIEKNKVIEYYEGIPVYSTEKMKRMEEKEISIIITPVSNYSLIVKELEELGVSGRKIPIWEIVGDNQVIDRLRYINGL